MIYLKTIVFISFLVNLLPLQLTNFRLRFHYFALRVLVFEILKFCECLEFDMNFENMLKISVTLKSFVENLVQSYRNKQ